MGTKLLQPKLQRKRAFMRSKIGSYLIILIKSFAYKIRDQYFDPQTILLKFVGFNIRHDGPLKQIF